MKRSTILKRVLYGVGIAGLVVTAAIWVFVTFYFESTLNRVVIPKIEQATFKATQGRFTLTLDKISYGHGRFICNTFVLSRAAYRGTEHGMVLGHLTLDSARFDGISWWDVLWGNDLNLSSLQLDAPRIFMINADSDKTLPRLGVAPPSPTVKKFAPISFDSIILRNADIFLPMPRGKTVVPSYRGITLQLHNFSLDPAHTVGEPVLFSERVEFDVPGGRYAVGDSMYSIEVKHIHGSLSDSLITVDSLSYRSNYSEQAFANLHKYFQDRIEYRCTGIRVEGIDFGRMIVGGPINVHKCSIASWDVDYYGDLRVPHNPHPPDAILPNSIIRSIKMRMTIDSIVLNEGTIRHRERAPGSTHASSLVFTHAQVRAHPFSTDTASHFYAQPLRVAVRALFLNEAQIVGTIIYPVHQQQFDLQLDATVGAFELTSLNSYLISNERKQIMSGRCLGGTLRMDVHSGVAMTMVRPLYTGVSMRVLPTDVKASRSFFDGIKSFIANNFVLRTTNIDEGSSKAIAGTTTYVRSPKEEFFEFIWKALRKSIQKVVGF